MITVTGDSYKYECPKCGVDNFHGVEYIPPFCWGGGKGLVRGPALVVTCSVCGYIVSRPPVDGEGTGCTPSES